MPKLTQRYGFPFRGYKFLEPSQLAPRGYIVGDDSLISHDLLIDPIDGKLMRRGGTASVGSTTGLLETVIANASPRGLQVIGLDSPSLTDGYATHAVLFADESKGYAWLYWRSTNGAEYDLNLGENFSTTNYSLTAAAVPKMKWIPLWYESLPALTGAGLTTGSGVTRGANEITRRFLLSGSRCCIQMGNRLYWPGYTGTPGWWDRASSDTSTSATQERLGPTGLIPPLFPPTLTAADISGLATTTAAPWKEGDQFYYSLAFVNESGEVSMPYIPSSTTLAAPAGMYSNYYGLVTVPSATGNVDYYPYLVLKNLAIGPNGTRARLLCRSKKVDSTLAGAAPNRLQLFACGIINDNVSTTFNDFRGNDLSLVDVPEKIRLDRKWPDRGRYIFSFDQRACVMGLRQNPAAIIIAPTAAPGGTTRSQSISDTGGPGANWFVARVLWTGNLQLRYCNASPDATPVTSTITLSSTKTLRAVVDEINALTTASTGGEWAAQLAPGVDENITSDKLRYTSITTTGTITAGSTSASGFTSGVSVGMSIHSASGFIPAGTSVDAINVTTGTITMSAAATNTQAGDTIEWADNTGDDDILNEASRTYGNERAVSNALPLVLYFNRDYLYPDYYVDPTQHRDLSFTTGGPLDPSYAANSYVTGNRRTAPADAGRAMGGAPLLNGAVTYYSRAIGRFANLRGGKTGDDADYRNEIETWGRGCISPYSIVHGNGWTGCLTDVGYEVRDSLGSRIISHDLYNPASNTGEWAYAIGKCKAAANSIDGTDFQFYAHVDGGRLFVSYRRSASNATPAHIQIYDFSASVEGSGLAQVLRPDGIPWGWSAPLTYSWRAHSAAGGKAGAIGSVRKSDGTRIYTCDDTNDKTTCGLVQQIENGTWTDGSDRVTAGGYLALDLHDTLEKKSALHVRIMYHAPGAAEQGVLYRSKNQAGGQTIALPLTTAPYGILSIPVALRERALTNQTQIRLQALGNTGSTKVHFLGVELDAEILPGMRSNGG